jgi:hypothetical protein
MSNTLRSMSGELAWDWGAGLVTVDTPCAQGVAGFLAQAGVVELGDVTIKCGNEYGAILIVSLDGEPLATSRRILIQTMTEEKPYGFAAEGGRVTALGGTPFNVRRIAASVSLRLAGDGAARVIALDGNGYATDAEVIVAGAAGESLAMTLAEDAIYHIVERR